MAPKKKKRISDDATKIRRRLKMLARSQTLTHSQLRVAIYCLARFSFKEARQIKIDAISKILNMKGNNVSAALGILQRARPPLVKSEKDGRDVLRKLVPITKISPSYELSPADKRKKQNARNQAKGSADDAG